MNSKQSLKNIADISNKINISGGNFIGDVTIHGYQVWHAGNFNPSSHNPNQPDIVGNYLPLTGGTLTGGLTVNGTTKLNVLNTSGKTIINEDLHLKYFNRDAKLSWTDRNNFKLLIDNNSIFATNGTSVLNTGVDLQVKGNDVWHKGNLFIDNYVKKTGDTISGELTINNNCNISNLLRINGAAMWGNQYGIGTANMHADESMNCNEITVRGSKIHLGNIDVNNDQGYLSATNIWAYNEVYCSSIRIDRKRLTISQSAPGNPQTGDVWISW